MKTIVVKATQRYDESSVWTSVNPVLLAGEIGVESDTNYFKVGDGKTAWNELDYAAAGAGGEKAYYTPSISQTSDSTATFSFVPSIDTMPTIAPTTINLPAGKTPIAGVDYFTEADKQAMLSDLLAMLPIYDGEVIPTYKGEIIEED